MAMGVSMRILVCGGRDFTDKGLLYRTLDRIIYDGDHTDYGLTTIISGSAKGADTLAEYFARDYYCGLETYHANWEKYGKSAGPIRNQQMIDEGEPDLVVAFPGGKGTADMVRRAKKHGIKVVKIES